MINLLVLFERGVQQEPSGVEMVEGIDRLALRIVEPDGKEKKLLVTWTFNMKL